MQILYKQLSFLSNNDTTEFLKAHFASLKSVIVDAAPFFMAFNVSRVTIDCK
jgi:hypothetical protein